MAGNKVIVKVPFASGKKHLQEEFSIDDLLRISSPIIDQALAPIQDALDKADLGIEDLDLVILAGGSSQLPGVYRKIYEKLNIEPRLIPKNLMLAISYGAALYQREIFMYPQAKRDVRTLGHTLGIKVNEGGRSSVQILLNHNEKLPAAKTYYFHLEEGQTEVALNLVTLQGNTEIIGRNLKQRILTLQEEAAQIKVEIVVNENKLIEMSAYDPAHPENKAIIQVDRQILSGKNLEQKRKALGLANTTNMNPNGDGDLQPCIGIDLGTTTTEFTYANRSGEAELYYLENPGVPPQYSKYCFPSIVFFRNGLQNVEVANIAACDAASNANDVDKVCQNFKIEKRDGYVIKAENKGLTVCDVSAILLNKVWQTAQAAMPGTNMTSAVVTVPAAFDFDACQDTYNAAKMAGIENVTLIDEPTAAFLYYKQVQKLDTTNIRNVLVFDFGGGTADVAVLDVKKEDSASGGGIKDCLFTVLGVSGNDKCGGKNVDDAIVGELKNRFEEKNNCKISSIGLKKLRAEVEKAKVKLSEYYSDMEAY